MLHMHSKQYLHLLYTTLQAFKNLANDQEADTVWTQPQDASQKHDGFNWLIGARAHCKHVDLKTLHQQPRKAKLLKHN